jgi:AcrR family transcriptional regulator
MAIISFKLNHNLFLRDPQGTDLGQRIIQESIYMIDEMGFEQFTFKKLADKIESTEASVYRYFENKHRLLIYLIDWYWTWVDYKMDFAVQNLVNPIDQLKASLKVLVEEKQYDPNFAFVYEPALQRIVMSEFDKTYLTKQVDNDNREGLFLPYKSICKKVAAIILQVNPGYQHPHSLISTVLLTINHQLYYAKHLPSLSDIKYNAQQHYNDLYTFCELLILKSIQK